MLPTRTFLTSATVDAIEETLREDQGDQARSARWLRNQPQQAWCRQPRTRAPRLWAACRRRRCRSGRHGPGRVGSSAAPDPWFSASKSALPSFKGGFPATVTGSPSRDRICRRKRMSLPWRRDTQEEVGRELSGLRNAVVAGEEVCRHVEPERASGAGLHSRACSSNSRGTRKPGSGRWPAPGRG